MVIFVYVLLTVILLTVLIAGAYMHDAIDWYTEPDKTDIEKQCQNIKERIAWQKLNMVGSK